MNSAAPSDTAEVAPDMLEFYVQGIPLPKGSGTVWKGKWFETANKPTKTRPRDALDRWSATIAVVARNEARKQEFKKLDCPVSLSLYFYVIGKAHKHGSGDIDKLARAVLDALEGVAYVNDARVTKLAIEEEEELHGTPGVWIEVTKHLRRIQQ